MFLNKYLNKSGIYFIMVMGVITSVLLLAGTVTAQDKEVFPDLMIRDLRFSPESPQEGEKLAITAIIENVGRGAAEGVPVMFFLDSEDEMIGKLIIDSLEPGLEKEFKVEVMMPKSVERHKVIAIIDPAGRISETNKENNRKESPLAVREAEYPVEPVDLDKKFREVELPAYVTEGFLRHYEGGAEVIQKVLPLDDLTLYFSASFLDKFSQEQKGQLSKSVSAMVNQLETNRIQGVVIPPLRSKSSPELSLAPELLYPAQNFYLAKNLIPALEKEEANIGSIMGTIEIIPEEAPEVIKPKNDYEKLCFEAGLPPFDPAEPKPPQYPLPTAEQIEDGDAFQAYLQARDQYKRERKIIEESITIGTLGGRLNEAVKKGSIDIQTRQDLSQQIDKFMAERNIMVSTEIIKVATPALSPPSGSFTDSIVVSITCDTPGATIHYTQDGSELTEDSPEYKAPLTLTTTTTIKARGFKTGCAPSEIASETYTKQDKIGILGDANGDGEVNIFDALLIAKYVAGDKGASMKIRLDLCDIQKRGQVDIFDALMIAKYLAKYPAAESRPSLEAEHSFFLEY